MILSFLSAGGGLPIDIQTCVSKDRGDLSLNSYKPLGIWVKIWRIQII